MFLPTIPVHKPVADIIIKAGSARDDFSRYTYLLELEKLLSASDPLKPDLKKIMQYAEPWALGKDSVRNFNKREEHAYLFDFTRELVKSKNPIKPLVTEDSALYPIWCIYHGRILIYLTVQMSWLRKDPKNRTLLYGSGRNMLEIANTAFPENQTLPLYFNRPAPWGFGKAVPDNAPKWAVLQREAVEKLTEIIHWWVDNRQLPNGEYGGGWNDDVEMWRWWSPVLTGFKDEKIEAAQALLSRNLITHPRLEGGYLNHVTDAEHSAEETSDVITPMMHIDPGSEFWVAKTLQIFNLMQSKWTGRNDKGQLQFKSTFFSVDEVDLTPRKACDTIYHFRTMQPVLLYWQRTQDKKIGKTILDWLSTWVEITFSGEKGKPVGITPTAIHWPDGQPGGIGKNWWDPENTHDPIYNWPNRISDILNSLLLAYHITGDEYYLKPMKSMAAIRSEYLSHHVEGETIQPGSLSWCASQLGEVLPEPLSKYFMLTGDDTYNHLLVNDANGYVKFILSGEIAPYEQELNKHLDAFRQDKAIYTSEVRHTDRVLALQKNYLQYYYENLPNPGMIIELCQGAITGEPGGIGYFPVNAVKWHTKPEDIAVLVVKSNQNLFKAQLFNFKTTERIIGLELLMLSKNNYTLTMLDAKNVLVTKKIALHEKTYVELQVPPSRFIEVIIA